MARKLDRPLKVVILVPRRSDGGRRDQLWAFTKTWLTKHHPDWEIFEGDNPLSEGLFNRGLAINRAAEAAGDWDVAVIHDGDNVAHPACVREAVDRASNGPMTFAGDTYMYQSEPASNRILAEPDSPWFPRPWIHDRRVAYSKSILHKHISGVQAVSRVVWDATGGFLEHLKGWGSDDSVFAILCNLFGCGVEWVEESTILHFWHPHSEADTNRAVVKANRLHLMELKKFERRGDRDGARAYLANLGHTVP